MQLQLPACRGSQDANLKSSSPPRHASCRRDAIGSRGTRVGKRLVLWYESQWKLSRGYRGMKTTKNTLPKGCAHSPPSSQIWPAVTHAGFYLTRSTIASVDPATLPWGCWCLSLGAPCATFSPLKETTLRSEGLWNSDLLSRPLFELVYRVRANLTQFAPKRRSTLWNPIDSFPAGPQCISVSSRLWPDRDVLPLGKKDKKQRQEERRALSTFGITCRVPNETKENKEAASTMPL